MDFRKHLLCAALIIACLSSVVSGESIIDPVAIGVGARPMALGRAYVGLANDASAVFLNPAGLSSSRSVDMVSMKATLMNEVGYTVLAGAFPLQVGRIAAGYVNSSVSGIPLTRWTDESGIPRPETYAYTDYGSSVYMISYGANAAELFGNERLDRISLGASVKYYTQSFSDTSPSLEGASGSGADLDLAAKFRAAKWLDIGIVFSNILPSDMGGAFVWRKNSVSEDIPASLRIGSAFKLIGPEGISPSATSELTFLFDIEKEMDALNDLVLMHSGLEWKPVKQLSLRIGLDQQQSAQVSGVTAETNLTYGVGINFAPVSFDYAYHGYGGLPENTTHYFSMGLKY